MFGRGIAVAIGCSLLAFGCAEPPAEHDHETHEIIDNLIRAGFPADDITVVDGVVYTGNDAEVSLAASREMLEADGGDEQYRTNNLIGPSITKICINAPAFTGVFSTALDLAIQNYEEQPLRFAMARAPSSGCSFTINAVIQAGLVGGFAGFPSGGLPFSTVTIGGGLSTFSVDTIEHVITHELGHTIGFRHADFFNRAISCPTGGNEGDGGVGAIHIPGTPTGATVGGSIMNSCFRTAETGEFTGSDLTALFALYAAPVAAPLDFPIAFQANTTELWVVGPGLGGPTGLLMMPGTSPSFTRLANGGFQVAFQANTGRLWTVGSLGAGDLGLAMAPGTSPSITRLGASFQIAFQANTGRLWTTGAAGTGDLGLGMAPGTSPSITPVGGSFQIAFHANTATLWTTGVAGTANLGLGMAGGTSPSITTVGGSFQIAFHANTATLWTTGVAGTANLGLGMAAGTSPSIMTLGGSYQIAFHANTATLWTTGAAGTANFGLGVRAGTSPSIAPRAAGGFNIAFHANTGTLWRAGSGGAGDLSLGVQATSSPSTN